MSEWKDWNGGSAPLGPDKVVRIRLRGGAETEGEVHWWSWTHGYHPQDYDIIAYKEVR